MLLEEEKCGCEHDHEEDECCCGHHHEHHEDDPRAFNNFRRSILIVSGITNVN